MEHDRNEFANPIDHLHGARLAEHQETRLDAANERRNCIQALRRRLRCEALADGLLDARQIDDALAHDGFGHLTKISGFRLGHFGFAHRRLARHREPYQLLIETILDAQQGRCNVEYYLLFAAAPLDDGFEALDLAVDIAAQLAETQHAQRIGDFP